MNNSLPKENIIINHSVSILPYQTGFEESFLELVQRNKERLMEGFPNLLQKNEHIIGTKSYFVEKIHQWNKNIAYAYLIFFEKELIGHFNIKDINVKKSTVELSYFIDKNYEKRGIVFSIIENRKTFIFDVLNIKTIKARCATDNTTSEKVMQKAGMQYEGTIHQNYRSYNNIMIDTYIYSISK